MPLFFVNPTKRRRVASRKASSSSRKGKTTKKPARKRKPKGKSMPKKRLYGAAAKARAKKLAKQKRRASARKAARARKNPAAKRKRTSGARKRPAKSSAAKKAAATRRRKAAARSAAAKKAARTRKRRTGAKRRKNPAGGSAVKRRKKTTTRRRRRKAPPLRSNPKSKRSAAARKAARTRKAKAARRRAAARKAARSRRRRNPSSRPRVPGTKSVKLRKRKRYPSKSRGIRALSRARRTVRYERRYPQSSLARAFIKKHKLRANPVGGAVDAMKQAVPIGASFYVSKALCARAKQVPGLSALGQHAAPACSVGLVFLASFGTRKVLRKQRQSILTGTGLNAVDTVLRAYMPDNIKSMIGMSTGAAGKEQGNGDQAETESGAKATGEYVEVGEYVDMGLESELGEYVELGNDGAYAELGAEEDLGLEAELGQSWTGGQIGHGIGTPQSSKMIKAVPERAMSAPVPSRSFTKQVPDVSSGFDNPNKLYSGIFGGPKLGY